MNKVINSKRHTLFINIILRFNYY